MSLLEDITSKDPHRIWSSACAIRTLRDPQALSALIAHIEEIKQSTQGVPLGGALRPNSNHLEFAIRKLEILRDSHPCFCALYPLTDMYNPVEEEKEGNVTMLSTLPNAAEWTTQYTCRCRLCNTEYQVKSAEYHYTWWKWTRL